jgi:hypothetical protein
MQRDVPLNTYSIALHLYQGDELVAQGDTGLPYGPVHAEIDVSTLPPGNYEVRVGVYAWETGERLPGVDVGTGAEAELLALGHFSLP